MTQNEVDIIKNSVLDATEAYVEARLGVLDFVKTQIGVTVGNPEKRSDKKYYHTVRCNATRQNPKGITYNNVLSVGNSPFPPNCVVFLVAPNAQFSNQFILGQLDDTPVNITAGSIALGGEGNNAPIYLTSEAYQYNNKTVYGHIGSFYITQTGLVIEGTNHDISEITGKQVRLSEWKQVSSTQAFALSMMMDVDNSRIAINTNGYTNGGLIVSNAYGWDGNGNFNEPTNGNYIRIEPRSIDYYIDGDGQSIGHGGLRFLARNQDNLYDFRVFVDSSKLQFSCPYGTVSLPWGSYNP